MWIPTQCHGTLGQMERHEGAVNSREVQSAVNTFPSHQQPRHNDSMTHSPHSHPPSRDTTIRLSPSHLTCRTHRVTVFLHSSMLLFFLVLLSLAESSPSLTDSQTLSLPDSLNDLQLETSALADKHNNDITLPESTSDYPWHDTYEEMLNQKIAEGSQENDNGYFEYDYLDANNYLYTNSLDSPEFHISPESSWQFFVDHLNENKSKGKKDKKKDRQEEEANLTGDEDDPNLLPKSFGSPVPSASNELSSSIKQELLAELEAIVTERIERSMAKYLPEKCKDLCSNSQRSNSLPIYDTRLPLSLNNGFHCNLQKNLLIMPNSLSEVTNFYLPPNGGSFLRGTGMNLWSGRFTAPQKGVYQFTVSAQVKIQGRELRRMKGKDSLIVLLCLESVCRRKSSLEYISPIGQNREFTINFTGVLLVQGGQYVSIFIQNDSEGGILIKEDSTFSGVQLGA